MTKGTCDCTTRIAVEAGSLWRPLKMRLLWMAPPKAAIVNMAHQRVFDLNASRKRTRALTA